MAVLLAAAALAMAALAINFPEQFREYRLYLTEKLLSLDFTFDALTE